MFTLIKLTDNDYVIDSPAKMGIVKISDSEAVMIDSGSDPSAAKRALRFLDELGLTLTAVYNTHSHADHIGGNRLLQERTGCKIYAAGMEYHSTAYPYFEPVCLYGGLPTKELEHKFLLAEKSDVLPLTADVLPQGFKLLDLSGHSNNMTGFLTPDGTAFIGDSVSSPATLQKYGVCYTWDPSKFIQTCEFLKTVKAARFVPSHAEISADITALADINIKATEKVSEKILNICESPKTAETVLKEIFDFYSLTMNAQQYALVGSTVRCYLSSLYRENKIAFSFEDNKMLWQKI